MNAWDIVVLLLVAAVLVWAVASIRKGKVKCSGSCDGCTRHCERRMDTRSNRK